MDLNTMHGHCNCILQVDIKELKGQCGMKYRSNVQIKAAFPAILGRNFIPGLITVGK